MAERTNGMTGAKYTAAALAAAAAAAAAVLSSSPTTVLPRCDALSFRAGIPPRVIGSRRHLPGAMGGPAGGVRVRSPPPSVVRDDQSFLVSGRGGGSAGALSARASRGGDGEGGGGRRRGGSAPSRLAAAIGGDDDDSPFRYVPPDSVLDAVRRSSSSSDGSSSSSGGGGGRIVASDLSASAGVSLSQARSDLQTLASLTGAAMAVTDDGEILYTFPSDLRGTLRRRSARYRARAFAKRVWPGLFYVVRVSFGIMMLASLVTIFASLAALSAAGEAGSEGDEDDRRRGRGLGPGPGLYGDPYGGRRGGGGVHFHFGPSLFNSWFGPSPFDIFYYRPYYGYYGRRRRPPLYGYGTYTINPWGGEDPAVQRRDDIMGRTSTAGELSYDEEPTMSFLEAFYSYVFGDGDPNCDVEQRLLAGAASLIRSNGGAVTAEQLASFLLEPPSPEDAAGEAGDYSDGGIVRNVDESYVLPIVTKLGGEPTVTDDGDIVYVFPDMAATTAASTSSSYTTDGPSPDLSWMLRETQDEVEESAAMVRAVPPKGAVVQEEEVEFSLASPGQKVAAAALGVVNLAGALALGRALSGPKLSGVKLVGTLGVVQRSYPLLLAYAVLYNAIPLVRYVKLKRSNGAIRRRNSDRRGWVGRLRSAAGGAGGSIGRKLKAARGMARRIRNVDEEKIVFDTTEDGAERRRRMQQEAMEEFDDLLFDE